MTLRSYPQAVLRLCCPTSTRLLTLLSYLHTDFMLLFYHLQVLSCDFIVPGTLTHWLSCYPISTLSLYDSAILSPVCLVTLLSSLHIVFLWLCYPNPTLLWLCYPTSTLFFFYNCTVQVGFSHGKFGLPSPGKVSCDRIAPPNLQCMLGDLVFP